MMTVVLGSVAKLKDGNATPKMHGMPNAGLDVLHRKWKTVNLIGTVMRFRHLVREWPSHFNVRRKVKIAERAGAAKIKAGPVMRRTVGGAVAEKKRRVSKASGKQKKATLGTRIERSEEHTSELQSPI